MTECARSSSCLRPPPTSPSSAAPPGRLSGQRFLRSFGTNTPSWGAAYAAQATEVLLDAIARSNGTRASVLQQLRSGIVGPIRFDHNGDIVNGPFTILRLQAGGHAVPDPVFANTVVDRVITPPANIVPLVHPDVPTD